MHDGLFAPAGPFWHIIALQYSICEGFLKAAGADEFLIFADLVGRFRAVLGHGTMT